MKLHPCSPRDDSLRSTLSVNFPSEDVKATTKSSKSRSMPDLCVKEEKGSSEYFVDNFDYNDYLNDHDDDRNKEYNSLSNKDKDSVCSSTSHFDNFTFIMKDFGLGKDGEDSAHYEHMKAQVTDLVQEELDNHLELVNVLNEAMKEMMEEKVVLENKLEQLLNKFAEKKKTKSLLNSLSPIAKRSELKKALELKSLSTRFSDVQSNAEQCRNLLAETWSVIQLCQNLTRSMEQSKTTSDYINDMKTFLNQAIHLEGHSKATFCPLLSNLLTRFFIVLGTTRVKEVLTSCFLEVQRRKNPNVVPKGREPRLKPVETPKQDFAEQRKKVPTIIRLRPSCAVENEPADDLSKTKHGLRQKIRQTLIDVSFSRRASWSGAQYGNNNVEHLDCSEGSIGSNSNNHDDVYVDNDDSESSNLTDDFTCISTEENVANNDKSEDGPRVPGLPICFEHTKSYIHDIIQEELDNHLELVNVLNDIMDDIQKEKLELKKKMEQLHKKSMLQLHFNSSSLSKKKKLQLQALVESFHKVQINGEQCQRLMNDTMTVMQKYQNLMRGAMEVSRTPSEYNHDMSSLLTNAIKLEADCQKFAGPKQSKRRFSALLW